MLKRSIAFGAVAAALVAPAAYAEPVAFDAVDTDRDRIITRAEWNRAANAGQAASGASADLVVVTLTPVQAQVMNEQRRESLFRALDANGDGTVSKAEAGLNTDLMNAYARVDRNGDGKLDRQEFVRVHVNDGAQKPQKQAGGAAPGASQGASSAAGGSSNGGITVKPAPIPSRDIDEAAVMGEPFRRGPGDEFRSRGSSGR